MIKASVSEMTSNMQSSQEYFQAHRPGIVTIAGIMMILAGIFGFINSYLILASAIFFGWFIVGLIGLVSFATGIGLMLDADWAYTGALNLAILNLFVGFIEIIGAFNYHYAILGWVGIGQGIGFGTLGVSAIALYLLYRNEVRSYFGVYY